MKNLKNLTIVFALLLFAAVNADAQQQPQTAVPAKPAAAAATPPTPTKSTPSSIALPKADEIIDKFVKATGGEAAYKKFNSFQMKGTIEIPAVGIKGTFESFHKAPSKNAVFMTIPGFGAIADVFNGSSGWMSDPVQGVRDKSADETAQAKLNADFYRFARLKELYPKREVKGVEKVEGADAYAVVLTAGDISETFYFDAKSGLLVRTDQTINSPEGKMPAKGFLSDYRNFEGVLMPHTVKIESPAISMILKTEEIKSNVAIDDAKFAKPTK
jgi:zinc protease